MNWENPIEAMLDNDFEMHFEGGFQSTQTGMVMRTSHLNGMRMICRRFIGKETRQELRIKLSLIVQLHGYDVS